MESIVTDLIESFEKGALTRRELIRGLTMLAATGASASAAAFQVTNLPKSIAFYRDIFGLTILGEDKPNEIVRMGVTKALVSLHHKNPTGIVDHFAIGIEKFNKDAVTQQLKQHGLTPEENLDAGFHVKDPEGMRVQIVNA
jgi:catechol 2,3-dioxygenase-like lactoylglutathione lyase family enzyme